MAERGEDRDVLLYVAHNMQDASQAPRLFYRGEDAGREFALTSGKRQAMRGLAAELRARAQGPKAKKPFGKKGKH